VTGTPGSYPKNVIAAYFATSDVSDGNFDRENEKGCNVSIANIVTARIRLWLPAPGYWQRCLEKSHWYPYGQSPSFPQGSSSHRPVL
jgi:hypothetical protein